MRTVLNVSLPQSMAQMVREEVERGKYASVSEFVRKLVRDWEEERVLSDIRNGEEEYKKGKAKVLKSLANLR